MTESDNNILAVNSRVIIPCCSLLALAGGNRRTADVRSKGFSQLFSLCKADFESIMTDYPDAQRILKKRAKSVSTDGNVERGAFRKIK